MAAVLGSWPRHNLQRALIRSRCLHRGFATLQHNFTVDAKAITISSLRINASFPHKWLRDSCQCRECVHPSTRQKLHNTADVPAETVPRETGVQLTSGGLEVEWANGHKSFYPTPFLEAHSSRSNLAAFHRDLSPQVWDIATISKAPHLFVPYSSLKGPLGLLTAMTQLAQYGILFVSSVPNAATLHETCELRKLASYFGEIRETFYGQLFDVKNVRNSANIAYTNLDLGLHMDLLYFKHPPRYQALHCLRNRVSGGASIFVDALQAAEELRRTSPAEFEILTEIPVPFHYINDGHHLHHEHPTIELAFSVPPMSSFDSASFSAQPPIAHVNYSPPFMAPLFADTALKFYDAFKKFTALLRRPQSTYIYTLKEGDAVLFDNRRVLHARTAFVDVEAQTGSQEETNRWLKGCYLESDALLDRIRVLRTKLEAGQS